MSEARLAASTGVINGKLYTAGGYGENIRRPILDTVECFNPKKNKWKSKRREAREWYILAVFIGIIFIHVQVLITKIKASAVGTGGLTFNLGS
jgi:hypothetical protein